MRWQATLAWCWQVGVSAGGGQGEGGGGENQCPVEPGCRCRGGDAGVHLAPVITAVSPSTPRGWLGCSQSETKQPSPPSFRGGERTGLCRQRCLRRHPGAGSQVEADNFETRGSCFGAASFRCLLTAKGRTGRQTPAALRKSPPPHHTPTPPASNSAARSARAAGGGTAGPRNPRVPVLQWGKDARPRQLRSLRATAATRTSRACKCRHTGDAVLAPATPCLRVPGNAGPGLRVSPNLQDTPAPWHRSCQPAQPRRAAGCPKRQAAAGRRSGRGAQHPPG